MSALKTLVVSLVLVASVSITAAQQVKLEAILKRVNDDDFVTLLDVRRARLLRLVEPATGSDNDIAMRLVARRLELAAVMRAAPKEATAQALAARRREWEATLGGAPVGELLRQTGMTDAFLDSWLKDDLRIRAYTEQAFGALAVPTRAQMLAYYNEHIADYTKDGIVQDFESAATSVRRTFQDARRAELVKAWVDSLVGRADVRDVR